MLLTLILEDSGESGKNLGRHRLPMRSFRWFRPGTLLPMQGNSSLA